VKNGGLTNPAHGIWAASTHPEFRDPIYAHFGAILALISPMTLRPKWLLKGPQKAPFERGMIPASRNVLAWPTCRGWLQLLNYSPSRPSGKRIKENFAQPSTGWLSRTELSFSTGQVDHADGLAGGRQKQYAKSAH
jgi:hypothetical protein